MKLKTFFVEDIKETITLDGQEFNHAISVFRLKLGDSFRLIDGKTEFEYTAKINEINKKNLLAKIENKNPVKTNPKANLSLYQAQLKNDKMEYIIQKATEIGVSSLIPFISNNVVKTGDLNENRAKQIAIESLKQSGRTKLLSVEKKLSFKEVLEKLKKYDLVLLAYERATNGGVNLTEACKRLKTNQKIAVVVGAEGGFEPDEINQLQNLTNVVCFFMGDRILRAETAAIALSSIFLKEMGEYDE